MRAPDPPSIDSAPLPPEEVSEDEDFVDNTRQSGVSSRHPSWLPEDMHYVKGAAVGPSDSMIDSVPGASQQYHMNSNNQSTTSSRPSNAIGYPSASFNNITSGHSQNAASTTSSTNLPDQVNTSNTNLPGEQQTEEECTTGNAATRTTYSTLTPPTGLESGTGGYEPILANAHLVVEDTPTAEVVAPTLLRQCMPDTSTIGGKVLCFGIIFLVVAAVVAVAAIVCASGACSSSSDDGPAGTSDASSGASNQPNSPFPVQPTTSSLRPTNLPVPTQATTGFPSSSATPTILGPIQATVETQGPVEPLPQVSSVDTPDPTAESIVSPIPTETPAVAGTPDTPSPTQRPTVMTTPETPNPSQATTLETPNPTPETATKAPTPNPTTPNPTPAPTTKAPTPPTPNPTDPPASPTAGRPCEIPTECESGVCARPFISVDSVLAIDECCASSTPATRYDFDNFCSGLPTGAACGSNGMCSSGVCIQNICSAGQQSTGEDCDDDADCTGGVCALLFTTQNLAIQRRECCASSTSPARYNFDNYCKNTVITPPDECCPNSIVATRYDFDNYCSGLPIGTACGSNGMCASGVCVGNVCREGQQAAGEACNDDADCVGGVCAILYSNLSTVGTPPDECCPNSIAATRFDFDNYCSGLPVGAACGSNEMCASGVCISHICRGSQQAAGETCDDDSDCVGGVCAILYSNVSTVGTPPVQCCPNSIAATRFDFDNYCSGLPVGAACGSNGMCASGVCISSICSGGQQAEGETCDDDADCVGDVCALLYSTTGEADQKECCTDGVGTIRYDFKDYCSGLPGGAPCGTNGMCSSGSCIMNSCSDGQQPAGEACDDDDDCLGGACGIMYAIQSTETPAYECCPDNTVTVRYNFENYCNGLQVGSACGSDGMCFSGVCGIVYSNNNPDSEFYECCASSTDSTRFNFEDYCSGLPMGAACGSNSMCASGVCVGNICSDGQGPAGEACDGDDDCLGGACGIVYAIESTESPAYECCPDDTGTVRYSFENYCNGLQVGSACGSDGMCFSGVCGIVYSNDNPDSEFYECCASSLDSTRFNFEDFCSGLPMGAACGSNGMCTSGVCVGNICGDGQQPAGEACDDDNDCLGGACGIVYAIEGTETPAYECCPDNTGTVRYSFEDYCGDLQTGSACGSNAVCTSSSCNSNLCD
ncbi:expressed unknown protein [Seminavis robusta]|uniref:Uncharacterized protein n=1 Tax=Seminavis robusta TaxID=568900 RepID=A0A9N8HGN9_9STRA|nr:expressed unknown protein [Seminavis robusta]|eukprot:Sro649_g181160.1 n/a (1169) ;mRNA; f:14609-18272